MLSSVCPIVACGTIWGNSRSWKRVIKTQRSYFSLSCLLNTRLDEIPDNLPIKHGNFTALSRERVSYFKNKVNSQSGPLLEGVSRHLPVLTSSNDAQKIKSLHDNLHRSKQGFCSGLCVSVLKLVFSCCDHILLGSDSLCIVHMPKNPSFRW